MSLETTFYYEVVGKVNELERSGAVEELKDYLEKQLTILYKLDDTFDCIEEEEKMNFFRGWASNFEERLEKLKDQ